MSSAITWAVAVFFLGMGLFALAAPQAILQPFGFVIDSGTTRSEVRAVYGGFGVAIAAILAYAGSASPDVRHGIVATVAIALAGMAFGRVVAFVLGDRTGFYPNWFYFLFEAGAAAALFWAA